MNCLCASNNAGLLKARAEGIAGAGSSPWVIGVKDVGVHELDSHINVCIMMAAWSYGNAFTYTTTRVLYSASLASFSPKFMATCLPNGSSIYCVGFSILIRCLSYLSVSDTTAVVFNWFVNLATTRLLCIYFVVYLTYFQFHRAFKEQGFTEADAYYKAPFNCQPYASYFGCLMVVFSLIFNGFWVLFPGKFTVADLFTCYFCQVFFCDVLLFLEVFEKDIDKKPA
ncbi:hypothetical protein BABINDRAFT_112597 [Babjeviella inositovora NRRL Y-12698]|uniref:Amino acid permease/ SLC12A domain-containing protein n=1 Tax=Babjeviella inositovora NRRL Y-12698 TaxID=984486 RepID=A0A1E3QW43_9ASCO|nr:uncharacterized protein BABINDRAFT_112597 [Babjeviella inositovora NRRL Y-12698]ODQ81878.1 hypothetical protein BABINDRAFT_112597 [Babjeviella inositovora NRRL Y-12698]